MFFIFLFSFLLKQLKKYQRIEYLDIRDCFLMTCRISGRCIIYHHHYWMYAVIMFHLKEVKTMTQCIHLNKLGTIGQQ